jgi:acyl dehydratase/CBS domain-containing protein
MSETMLVSLSVRDVMTPEVLTTAPDVTAREVATTLHGSHVGSLVVVDDGEPVGIVTESDLVRLVGEGRDLDAVRVSAFMSEGLLAAGPDERIERAAELLGEHDFRRLPVVGDGGLLGIVTTTDLTNYLPSLARNHRAWTEHRRSRPEGGSTAYEDREWEFERHAADIEGDSAAAASDDKRDAPVAIGDRVRFTKELSMADVEAFAEATGDTNRLHLDEAFARQTRFGGRIAHGVLTVGVVSAALARLPGVAIYLSQEFAFLGPVRPGDRVTAECVVTESLGQDRFRLATTVSDDGETVLDGEAVVMVEPLPDDAEQQAEPTPTTGT